MGKISIASNAKKTAKASSPKMWLNGVNARPGLLPTRGADAATSITFATGYSQGRQTWTDIIKALFVLRISTIALRELDKKNVGGILPRQQKLIGFY